MRCRVRQPVVSTSTCCIAAFLNRAGRVPAYMPMKFSSLLTLRAASCNACANPRYRVRLP